MNSSELKAFSQVFEFNSIPKAADMPKELTQNERLEKAKEAIESIKEYSLKLQEYHDTMKEYAALLKTAVGKKDLEMKKWEKIYNDLEVEKGFNRYGI